MSAERDAGLTALQNGNAAEAIPYLERAVDNAPNDLQALLPLGTAYGQTGRHADAVRVVMQAVTLQPSNPAVRYNLAVAYANAGHKEYALTAAQQALQLQPDYPQAREMVARLSRTSGTATDLSPSSPPSGQAAAPASYGQPTQTLPRQPAEPTVYGQSASPAPYGSSSPTVPPMTGGFPPGQTTLPYGAPGGAPSAQQPGAGSYQGHGAAAYGGSPPSTYYNPPPRPGFAQPPDTFDMKQAVTDWVRVIREPNAFFREQAERTGYNMPLAFLVTFGLGVGLCSIVSSLIQLALHPSSFAAILMQIVLGAAGGVIGAITGAFVWGAFLHVVGRMFGNRQLYPKSFRVAAYSRAPLLLFTAVSALIVPFFLPDPGLASTGNTPSPFGQMTPVQYTESSPAGGRTTLPPSGRAIPPNPFSTPGFQKVIQAMEISMGISILGYIWVWCLQAIGLQYAQDISLGGAAGTVIVALLIPFLLLGLIIGLLWVLIAGLIGASHASGFQNILSLVPSSLAVWRGV